MLPFDMTPATIVIGLALASCAVLAVRRLAKRGTCDCHDGCASQAGGCAGCAGCGATDALVAELDRTLEKADVRS